MKSIQAGFNFNHSPFNEDMPTAELSLEPNFPVAPTRVELSANGKLVPGPHELTLTGKAARLEVPDDTTFSLHFACHAAPSGSLSLDRIELAFAKPLRLVNIFTTLEEISSLLADRQAPAPVEEKKELFDRVRNSELLNRASEFLGKTASDLKSSDSLQKVSGFWKQNVSPSLDKLTETRGWKKLVETAEKTSEKAAEIGPAALEKSKALLNRAKELGESTIDRAIDGVLVTQIRIVAIEKEKRSGLKMAFSGNVVMNDRVRLPLDEVELPRLLLSRFSPEITSLLSQFCVSPEQGTSLSRTFLSMIDMATGEANADFEVTPWALKFLTRGDRSCQMALNLHRECQIRSVYTLGRTASALTLQMDADVACDHQKTFSFIANAITTDEKLIACGSQLDQRVWSLSGNGSGHDIEGCLRLQPGSHVYPNALTLQTHDPMARFDITLPLLLDPISLDGSIEFGLSAQNSALYIHGGDLKASCHARWNLEEAFHFDRTQTQFEVCEGQFDLACHRQNSGAIECALSGDLDVAFDLVSSVKPIPEFKLFDETMSLNAAGRIALDLLARVESDDDMPFRVTLDHSKGNAELRTFEWTRDRYKIASTAPLSLALTLLKAGLTSDGLTESSVQLLWNVADSPVLRFDSVETPILTGELWQGTLTADTSEQGIIVFKDGTGFFDHHFFNAILYPEHEKEKIAELLGHQPLLSFIERVLKDLSPAIGSKPQALVERLKRCFELCRAHGTPIDTYHVVSMPALARILSILLFERVDEEDEILPILNKIIHAEGFDRYKTEELLDRAFPNADLTHAGAILRVISNILDVIPYEAPQKTECEATCDAIAPGASLNLLPSANHLYDLDVVGRDAIERYYTSDRPNYIDHETTRARIYRFAGGYTADQLEWLLANHGADFSSNEQLRLNRLLAIKRRIQKQEPREGSFLVQDFNIDYFLQTLLDAENEAMPRMRDLSGLLDEYTNDCVCDEVTDCFATWLTPEDTGRLLAACIVSRIPNQLVQVNTTRLFNYMISRGRLYTLATLYEAGAGSKRILASLLMSLLNAGQALVKTPIDRVMALNDVLSAPEAPIVIPNRQDYLPGGRHAADSYYEKIDQAAEAITKQVSIYLQAKLRMQSERIAFTEAKTPNQPKRPPFVAQRPAEDDLAEILRGVEKGDLAGQKLLAMIQSGDFDEATFKQAARSAEKSYSYAYRVASAVIKKYPAALEHRDVKRFYARTYEALTIQVIDQNLLDDVDQVRHWFAVRSGIAADQVAQISRVERRKAIVETLYYYENERVTRLNDPMTWLDLRPAAGPVDLTILGAMGVITDGKQGKELNTAFERLTETRQIRVIRADTGNIKSLSYNADILQQEMRKLNSPFMLLGYSQGCANMMRAESNMFAGTPSDRATLDHLVARHFLFSAMNGSVHAANGFEKYRRTLIAGEKVLKSFSAVTSNELNALLFTLLRKFLDSPLITMGLNSVESLSTAGLRSLAVDAQFSQNVVSTEVQGIITEFIPESLIYMTKHFEAESGLLNDSQIGCDCAHGYFVYNSNASGQVLKNQIVPSCTLKAHHWFPLDETVSFIQTDLDHQNAVYQAPKDLMIVPAVEALLLFGRIARKNA